MSRTRVKYCGITREQDAREAARLGVDAIGLVFYDASPRHVPIATAKAISAALPPFVTTVGLFVDAGEAHIETAIAEVGLDLLQFHGTETPEECARYGRPYIKAMRIDNGGEQTPDIAGFCKLYAGARGILLDTYQAGRPGGTGETFDWDCIPTGLDMPLILAGGLDADNVAEAIARVRPWAVDVSGGIEAEKGIKDSERMRAFMHEVNKLGTG
ncbi:MAG TPA: phosphoribosylanthranilate isomerase [Gammaproteobacteria bacterium]|nr:phosphoribosylanthranilate isomerase [Gammaproteobacteria bacterium]